MSRIIIVLLIATLLVIPLSSGVEHSKEYCLNDTHSFWEEIVYNGSSDVILTWEHETRNCTYGCINGKCLPTPNESNDIAFIIGLIFPAAFFLYFALKLDTKHAALQILFIMIALLFVFLDTAALGNLSTQNNIALAKAISNSSHIISSLMIWVILIYTVVWVIYELLIKFEKIEPIDFNFGRD